jgi:hypothetical protein
MKSNKQRRAEIMARRELIRGKAQRGFQISTMSREAVIAYMEKLARNQSDGHGYGDAFRDFVARGFYVPKQFRCKDCNVEQLWTVGAQKFWYEKCGGDFSTTAIRCRPCRAKERERKALARAASLPGLLEKRARIARSTLQV